MSDSIDIGAVPDYPDEFYEPNEDFIKLEKAVESLLEKFADQEERLRNMANKLDGHLNTPDAHNPGVMRRK